MNWGPLFLIFIVVLFVLIIPIFQNLLKRPKKPIENRNERVKVQVPEPVEERNTQTPILVKETEREVSDEFSFEPSLDHIHLKRSIEDREYGTRIHPDLKIDVTSHAFTPSRLKKIKPRGVARGLSILKNGPLLKRMVIFHEIYKRPRSEDPWQ